jgi:hypothetical protein
MINDDTDWIAETQLLNSGKALRSLGFNDEEGAYWTSPVDGRRDMIPSKVSELRISEISHAAGYSFPIPLNIEVRKTHLMGSAIDLQREHYYPDSVAHVLQHAADGQSNVKLTGLGKTLREAYKYASPREAVQLNSLSSMYTFKEVLNLLAQTSFFSDALKIKYSDLGRVLTLEAGLEQNSHVIDPEFSSNMLAYLPLNLTVQRMLMLMELRIKPEDAESIAGIPNFLLDKMLHKQG